MDLSPVDRETTSDACARRLRLAVLGGAIAPGERLPPERELAARFGVNRVTLRTAIARLVAQGLLVARQGSGTRAVDYRRSGGPELLVDLSALAAGGDRVAIVADLLAARRGLARALLERIAEVRPDPAPVRAAVDAFALVVGEGPARLARADLAVVAALVDATGSPVFALCSNPLGLALDAFPALRAALYRAPEVNLAGWEGLLSWLADPRPAGVEVIVAAMAARDASALASMAAA